MMKAGTGVLLAAGAAGLFWLIKKVISKSTDHSPLHIVLVRKNGACGLREPLPDLEVHRGDRIFWQIETQCDNSAPVSLGNWRKGDRPIPRGREPVHDLHGKKLSRTVGPTNRRDKIPAVVYGAKGDYYYDVYIGDTLALDPMIRILD
jgi:hypothetical protein